MRPRLSSIAALSFVIGLALAAALITYMAEDAGQGADEGVEAQKAAVDCVEPWLHVTVETTYGRDGDVTWHGHSYHFDVPPHIPTCTPPPTPTPNPPSHNP